MPPKIQNPQLCLYHPLNGQSNSHLQMIIDHFQEAGIVFSLNESDPVEKAAVVLVDEQMAMAETLDEFSELLAKDQQVFLVYTGDKPLPFYRVWQWLGMGVEEVLSLRDKIKIGEMLKARLNRWAFIDQILTTDRLKKQLIGSSTCWQKVLRQVIEMACFTSAPVLIQGESGTGKELIARLIHDLDKRPDKQDLVLLDCTTIVPELSGSEFFGHEKGAFTNAVSTRDGAFALADRGTLFLDEIGELPLRLQAELLRVSQEGHYKRVGSNMWKKTQFRLVSATHRNLLSEVDQERFRQDLYYRIRTCVIQLPALRDRKLDIPELAQYFLQKEMKTEHPPAFSQEVERYLMTRDYPGNIRELRQLMVRIAYRHCSTGPITLGDIPTADREMLPLSEHSWQENGFKTAIRQAVDDGIGLKEIKRIAGDVALETAIEASAGNLQEAAKQLEVTDRLVQGFWAGRR